MPTLLNPAGEFCSACLTRTCATCGKTFRIRQVTQASKYCSHDCYAQSMTGQPAANKKHELWHPCVVCGIETRNTKYCGHECRWFGRRKPIRVYGTGSGKKHRHHIVPKHDGGADEEMNLTPPISQRLHAMFHYDRWKTLKQVGDYVAWRMLIGQMTTSEAGVLAQRDGARKGGLACRGTPKRRKAGRYQEVVY
jgi:hypothetical protein